MAKPLTPTVRLVMYLRDQKSGAWLPAKNNPIVIAISPMATNPQAEAGKQIQAVIQSANSKYGEENVYFIDEAQVMAIEIVAGALLMKFAETLVPIESIKPGEN